MKCKAIIPVLQKGTVAIGLLLLTLCSYGQFGEKVVTDRILFERATTLLSLGSEHYLDSICGLFEDTSLQKIRINYVHHNWPEKADQSFPQQRALAIKNYLVAKGVEEKAIITASTTQLSGAELSEINDKMRQKQYYVELTLYR